MNNKTVKNYMKHAAAILFAAVILLASVLTVYAEPILGYNSAVLLTKDGKAFDYREAAGQNLYEYDTLQGACANSGYGYFTLYNRNRENCRIVKVDLGTLNVVKVSAPLPIYHGNNLTYNTKKNLILATCCEVKKKRAVFIDPDTLTVVSRKDIKLKRSKKIPKSVARGFKGFTAIAYNEKHDCYVGRLRNNNNVIILDGNLNPVRYVKLKGKRTYLLSQGMESVGDYIYDVRSFKGKHKYNVATIHNMNGAYVGKLQLPYAQNPGIEVECIFHDGDSYYAGFYYTTSQKHDYKKYHVIRNNYIYKLNKY